MGYKWKPNASLYKTFLISMFLTGCSVVPSLSTSTSSNNTDSGIFHIWNGTDTIKRNGISIWPGRGISGSIIYSEYDSTGNLLYQINYKKI